MMTSLQNDRLIRALLREPLDRAPVWMMRQAGRYLPEYRELRAKVPDFMTFCKTPELACEVTLQPLERFNLDAAIIFSDILTIPDAMGMDLEFVSGYGPVIHNPIRSLSDVEKLQSKEALASLEYVMQAIEHTVKALDGRVPLIGFAGSPWTVATYMIEGQGSKAFAIIKSMMYREPVILHALLAKLVQVTIQYLNAQITAGAQTIMVFDSWGGVLTETTYREFSLQYMQKIAEGIQRQKNGQKIPLIFFTKNGGQWLEMVADSGCDAIGLDWTLNIGKARQRVGEKVALQGNLDPFLLFSKPDNIKSEVKKILRDYGSGSGHVFNLGHGIDKNTPIEGVQAMIAAVSEL